MVPEKCNAGWFNYGNVNHLNWLRRRICSLISVRISVSIANCEDNLHSARTVIAVATFELSVIEGSPISDLITATQVNVVSLSVILSGDKVRVLFSVFVLSSEVVTVVSLLLLFKLVISVSPSAYPYCFSINRDVNVYNT